MSDPSRTRVWRPEWHCNVGSAMVQHRRGHADPTWLRTQDGWLRGTASPLGAATLFVRPRPDEGTIDCTAWGAGADWVLEQAPRLLGAADRPPTQWFPHPVVDRAMRARPNWRFARTDNVIQDAVPTVIEQKVTGQEAFGSYRDLVRRYGSAAPGPAAERGLLVPPSVEDWKAVPSHGWLSASVDHARAGAVTQILHAGASYARTVEQAATGADAEAVLMTLPGVGRWTAAEVRLRSLGDQDAVSYGDWHVAKDFGWAVAGREFSDDELEEFLRPWAGHRGRVVKLVRAYWGGRPRHGARMAPRRHMPGQRAW